MIYSFCQDVNNYLSENKNKVAVIHSDKGKRRAPMMIVCYLLFVEFYENYTNCMEFLKAMISRKSKFDLMPSQKRYIDYFTLSFIKDWSNENHKFCSKEFKGASFVFLLCLKYLKIKVPKPLIYIIFKDSYTSKINFVCKESETTLYLNKVTLTSPPKLTKLKDLQFKIYQNRKKIFMFKGNIQTEHLGEQDEKKTVTFNFESIPIKQDIKIMFLQKLKGKLFYFWFNTSFVNNLHLSLNKSELDGAHKDKKEKVFSNQFFVDLFFHKKDNF
eukprot:TRINITY_DN1969_c0_g1_i2.p1 TRINITY_DN1969_c0_g1~~TRINITY_DN1969_c0_g1_i2.p1  ORF type:complete len:272 (-),score=54.77 TRINITY_DN1969_c0_g1_i2:63-878(-)